MPRKKPTKPQIIKELLIPYLDKAMDAYSSMSEDLRTPTLPVTNDGKINVTLLTKALGLPDHNKQYFHKNKDLRDAVNLVAKTQGVLQIGARAADLKEGEVMRAQMATANAANKKSNEELVEALHTIDMMTKEIADLKAEVTRLEGQIDSIYTNGDILIRGDE